MPRIKKTLRLESIVHAFLEAEAERMNTSAAVVANEILKNHINNTPLIEQAIERMKDELIKEMKSSERVIALFVADTIKEISKISTGGR